MGTTDTKHFDPAERDEARDFGDEQTMSVDAKNHPTLGPTEEAQDVDRLPRQIVGMPAFNDPNNPVAASGSVNLSLNDHPVSHSEDYGADAEAETGFDHVEHTMSEHSRELREYDLTSDDDDPATTAAKNKAAGLSEDRGEWSKADWQTHAKSLGLATSGNKQALQERVEAHESAAEERDTFSKEVSDMNRAELDKAAAQYKIDPTEYSTKELLAEAVVAAEFGEDVPAGDKAPTDDTQ